MTSGGVTGGDRHISIDAVRGFAILGILLMNIVGMGMPAFAYIDPTYYGGHEGADLWTWAISNVLVDGKMRSLFTMLFGASTVLIAERAEGQAFGPIRTHYSRMFWLFLIGVAHAYLLWWGDILVCYALAGLVIFPFRKLDARLQIGIGAAILAALLAFSEWQFAMLGQLHDAVMAPGATAALKAQWAELSFLVDPPKALAAQQIAGFGGNFAEALAARIQMAQILQFQLLPTDEGPEAVGQMFIGMGLFRLGFFTLKWPSRAYGAVIAVAYLIAVPLTAWLAWQVWASGFETMTRQTLMGWQAGTRTIIALGHASVLLLLIRAGALGRAADWLAAAGRMAFSNYLMTSLITCILFCGFGFGLYGQLSRFELLYVVAGVWVFILVWSKPWLERFHYGPFEWVWRSLVRLKPQPFLKRGGVGASAPAPS